MEAARGRESAAGVLLPSNPVLSVMAGARNATGMSAVNWLASLSQEIEIGGRRGARLDAARAEVGAQAKRASLTEREVAAAALVAYFEALSARDELALVNRLAESAEKLSESASSRAAQGLIPEVDANVAYAASMRARQTRAAVERRALAAHAALATTIGADPTKPLEVDGELVPLAIHDDSIAKLTEQAAGARAEVEIARAEQVANEHRATVLRRSRVPNITVNVSVGSDGFGERIITGGISVPIPLPSPLGRTNAGEIAEAVALAQRAGTEVERLRRQVRLEVVTAAQALASRRRELAAFDTKRLVRVEESLKSLGEELAAGRVTVRDALLAQQGLLDLLEAYVEAKRALCVASVDLARAAGIALERGEP
ncbi:Heavy metal RND efflux outer membrane protein, CzcC family protein [Minicystis rosea]|nr:Heavy metal RND efflux outer membrane protein, CzcC family protein [Minicystis rosea]